MRVKRIFILFFLIAFAIAGVSSADETKKAAKKNDDGKAAKFERSVSEGMKKAWESVKKTARDVSRKLSEPEKKKGSTKAGKKPEGGK